MILKGSLAREGLILKLALQGSIEAVKWWYFPLIILSILSHCQKTIRIHYNVNRI